MEATVHLVRHGEVYNPDGILYGRLPGYRLSERGAAMAQRLGQHFAGIDLTHLRCSPLERAQQTMAPIAAEHPALDVVTDDAVIEADNKFAGRPFGDRTWRTMADPRVWWWMRNPLRPTWGEPFADVAQRMRGAIAAAAEEAGEGGAAVIVSHQLPIWIARLDVEGRRFAHDPRRRECTLASVTTLTVIDGRAHDVTYAEPAADLLPAGKQRTAAFSAGS